MTQAMLPLIFVLPLIAFYFWMFWDLTSNDSLSPDARNYWVVAFIVLNVFAAAWYYITVYRSRT